MPLHTYSYVSIPIVLRMHPIGTYKKTSLILLFLLSTFGFRTLVGRQYVDLGNRGNNLSFLWVMDKVPKKLIVVYIVGIAITIIQSLLKIHVL